MSKWDYPGCEQRPNTEASSERKKRRTKQKRSARFGGPKHEAYVRGLPCCVSGARNVDAAHLDHAGAGGTDRDAHTDNLVPLVRIMHDELDLRTKGKPWDVRVRNFGEKHGLDLFAMARVVTEGFKNNWPAERVRAEWKRFGGR